MSGETDHEAPGSAPTPEETMKDPRPRTTRNDLERSLRGYCDRVGMPYAMCRDGRLRWSGVGTLFLTRNPITGYRVSRVRVDFCDLDLDIQTLSGRHKTAREMAAWLDGLHAALDLACVQSDDTVDPDAREVT